MKLLNPHLPPDTVHARKLSVLVFDWAGTTVDFGSLAPARTLERIFASKGIQLSTDDVRHDMGLPKRDHIARILERTSVRAAWATAHGCAPTAADAAELYAAFVPLQLACLTEYSTLIPGVREGVDRFRARGLLIASTTGYTREMLDLLLEHSAKAGYEPDCSLAPDDVGAGRPQPFMLYEIAVRLKQYPLAAMAKIGDTPADIHEGLNAGAWSIGVAGTGNAIGQSLEEFDAMPMRERARRLADARAELQRAGAHYVVDRVADLDSVLEDIDQRLRFPQHATQPV